MNMVEGIPIVDTMIGFKDAKSSHYVPPSVREGDQGDDHVADYMFKEVPVAAEDGIRDFCLSRGLGDVYKRQHHMLNMSLKRFTLYM